MRWRWKRHRMEMLCFCARWSWQQQRRWWKKKYRKEINNKQSVEEVMQEVRISSTAAAGRRGLPVSRLYCSRKFHQKKFNILFFSKYPFQMMMMMSLVRYRRLLTDELLKFCIEFIEDISASLENWWSCSGCSVPVPRSAGSARDATCDSLMANWFAQYFIERRWLCASKAAAYKSDATDEVWHCRNQSAFEWCGDTVVDRVASNHNMSAHTMQSFTHNTLARSVLCHWKMKMIKNWWSLNEDRREKERSSVEAINFIKKLLQR